MLGHEFTDQIASSNHLVFPALQRLGLTLRSIAPISELFTHMQLLAVSYVSAFFNDMSPPRHIIRSFLMALQKACTGEVAMKSSMTLGRMTLINQNSEHPVLTLQDIHYFTALNLTCLSVDLDWTVDLKDSDLLEIASLCQRLKSLIINDSYGWRAAGITPAGLAQFLQRCPSIRRLCVALDTRGYTLPPRIQANGGNPASELGTIDVVDSVIEAESIPALATFFADVVPLLAHDRFSFRS